MQRLFLILCIVCFITIPGRLSAQSLLRVSGQVKDTTSKGIFNATVSLLKAKDSSLVKVDITDNNGQFEFNNIKEDSCVLTVTVIGYTKYYSGLIVLDKSRAEVVLPPVELKAAEATSLQGVTVVATKPFVQRLLDRIVVNVDALISSAGSNALDILERSPGVQVDANGGVSLKGRQGVVVFINDKPTYMTPADLANYLRSLPASSLEVIEIMSTPPAKYDAAGNAGVINIRIKKLKRKGFNSNINTSYGQGYYPRISTSADLNYNINKVNLFANIGYYKSKYAQQLDIDRQFLLNDGSLDYMFSQETRVKKEYTGFNFRVGMDYYISDKSVLGFVASGFDNPYEETKDNVGVILNSNFVLDSSIRAISELSQKWTNQSANLNYNYKIDGKGKEITANVDYVKYKLKSDNSLVNKTFRSDNSLKSTEILIGNLPANIDIQTAKIDYTNPLKTGGSIDAGFKTSWIKTKNISEFYNQVNNTLVVNNELTNYFRYRENIVAGYLSFSKEFKKVSIQAGLRLEHTKVKGDQTDNPVRPDSSFTRLYTSLFPTFFAAYKPDSANKHQFIFSYGRRIDRPNYQDMNPFLSPVDKYTFFAGNPFLLPTFSHNVEISHTYNNIFTTAVQYSYTKDIISETIEQAAGVFIIRPGNVGKRVSWGVSMNADIRPSKAKWLSAQLNAGYTYNKFTGLLYNQQVNEEAGSLLVSVNSQFTISGDWSAEMFAGYQTRTVFAQISSEPIWVLNTGVKRKLWKGKGSVRLNIKDAFASIRPRGSISSIANSRATYSNKIDNRAIILSLTYNFNKGKSLDARQSGSSDPEQGRIRTN